MIRTDVAVVLSRKLLSDSARPLRFVSVGAFAGMVQLGVFAVLIHRGINPLVGNAVAFLLAVEVNFVLSSTFTWNGAGGTGASSVMRRWMAFNVACAGTAMLNFLVFATVRHVLPDIVASAVGIAATATINYLANDRLIFALRPALIEGAR